MRLTFFPDDVTSGSSGLVISEEMTNECIAQTWYCFLHSLGNPVDLSRPTLVSQTQSFYQYAIVSEDVIDPTHHPCLASLPEIFLRSMKGLAAIVDTFLGASREDPKIHHLNRPRCNSILHLLGQWLMEASLIGSPYLINNAASVTTAPETPHEDAPLTPSVVSPAPAVQPKMESHSKLGLFRKSSTAVPQVPAATPTTTSGSLDLPEALTPERFEAGRAEALGALCRIFCAKKTEETISPIYLARFYVALHEGLAVKSPHESNEVMAKILINCKDLMLMDLDGSLTLMPRILSALEVVLPQESRNFELRNSGIHLLASMLPFPAHFGDLTIKDLVPTPDPKQLKFFRPSKENFRLAI